MLDSMERRTSEPGALADLFRLDHLTTRMRRHAESLIVLSGAVPGRGWRDPVPVVDILRAAVAEVEDYVRVDVASESDDLVAGNAVSDITHLIAELVENAAVFSPPNTRIEVRAERVGTGLVAEVEDRGLGLSFEELDEINARLASPAEFDLAHSEQLGLFVVSRLAARHAIKVSLRRSVYGGTTAVVLMPFGVVVRPEEAGPAAPRHDGDRAAEGGPKTLTGRHRLPPPAAVAAEPGTGARTGEAEWPMAPWETGPITIPSEAQAPTLPATSAARAVLPSPLSPPSLPVPSAAVPPAGARAPWEDAPEPDDLRPTGSHLGMPIRVPQASMAPQLRAPRDADAQGQPGQPGLWPGEDEDAGFGARSPEATRSMLTMMQQGWRRGRMDDLDDPGGAPGSGN
jgi:anti-sigma regulatory factor (Ser/Thr protein kinase)